MAYVIHTLAKDDESQTVTPIFAQHVGKARVTWTPDRTKARRYRHEDTAEKAAGRIRLMGRAVTRFPHETWAVPETRFDDGG